MPSQAEQTQLPQPLLGQRVLQLPITLVTSMEATNTSVSVPYRRALVWAQHSSACRKSQTVGQGPSLDLLVALCLCSSKHGMLHCCPGNISASWPTWCPLVSAELLLTSHCPGCIVAWDCTMHFGPSNKNFTFQLEWKEVWIFFYLFWLVHAAFVWKKTPSSFVLIINKICQWMNGWATKEGKYFRIYMKY